MMIRSQVLEFLDRRGFGYYTPSTSDSLILTGFNLGTTNLEVFIDVRGDFMKIRSRNMTMVRPGSTAFQHLAELLNHMNRCFRFVKFWVDSDDGEVVGEADVWIEDNDLTEAQFNKSLSSFLITMGTAIPQVTKVIISDPDHLTQDDLNISVDQMAKRALKDILEKLKAEVIH